MAVKALLSTTRLRCKPASLTMPMSNSGMFFTALLFVGTVMLSVGLSDSASVPISSSPTTISATANDDADLELLASSKILMDHTSSTYSTSTSRAAVKIIDSFGSVGKVDDEDARLGKNAVAEEIVENNFSTSSGTDSTTLPILPVQKKFSTKSQQQEEQEQPNKAHSSSSAKKNERNSYEMSSSPLHVARCRATCLQKFTPNKVVSKLVTASADLSGVARTSPDELHLLPLLRLRRSVKSWSCQEENSECLTCWKSCELFEPKDNSNLGYAPSSLEGGDDDAERKTKQILPCSSLEPKQCSTGCEVACSFYDRFSSTTQGAKEGMGGEQEKKAFKGDPVVATRHESVLKIVPGKITWPPSSFLSSSTKVEYASSVPVVYVVIQEYPDRKWRQIAQTTETSIDIPTELTSAMSSKLRSVRVLVVSSDGLQSVYSPEKIQEVEQEAILMPDNLGSGKGSSRGATADRGNNGREVAGKITPESNDSSSPANTNDHWKTGDPVDSTITSHSTAPTRQSLSESTDAANVAPGVVPIPTLSINNELHVEGPFSFELRVVSLIHQKSLVIAELKWDEIGSNPTQEYLITWELTGGGLKGHLVTDSTSVTLSLWPDTTYQIQVEQFLLNLDSDGEQPESSTSSTSIKSLPLIVDTSEASYPMERPSALLSASGEEVEEEDEDDYEDEDVSPHEGNETGGEEESHKSFSGGFLNMTLFLAIAISALIFVLVILTVAAFTWTKMRKVSYAAENGEFGDSSTSPMITPTKNLERKKGYLCSSSCLEPEPLLSQDDFYWEEYCQFPSQVYHATTIPNNKHFSQYPFLDERGSPLSTAVSVISSSNCSAAAAAEVPNSYLSYYREREGSSSLSSNMAYSLLSDPVMTASSHLSCPSRSSGGGLH